MVSAAIRDISDRKRLEQVLRQKTIELVSAKSAAERANLDKTAFLASLSHELQKPVNAILGFAQTMESAAALPAGSVKDSVVQILKAGRHLQRLIEAIGDPTEVQSEKVPT